jgi:hypothetical protein
VAPPELRGLRSSTFDFNVGDPALGSLMISIKEANFDLGKLRQNEKRRDMTRSDVNLGLERQKNELFSDMEELVDSAISERTDETYEVLRDLLPSERSSFDKVVFSTSSASGALRSISIDKSRADAFRQVYDADDADVLTRSGVIVEINSDSATCLVKSPRSYRVTTCVFDAPTFDRLQADRAFKIGSRLQVSGTFWKRPRRDKMGVAEVIALELPT